MPISGNKPDEKSMSDIVCFSGFLKNPQVSVIYCIMKCTKPIMQRFKMREEFKHCYSYQMFILTLIQINHNVIQIMQFSLLECGRYILHSQKHYFVLEYLNFSFKHYGGTNDPEIWQHLALYSLTNACIFLLIEAVVGKLMF